MFSEASGRACFLSLGLGEGKAKNLFWRETEASTQGPFWGAPPWFESGPSA